MKGHPKSIVLVPVWFTLRLLTFDDPSDVRMSDEHDPVSTDIWWRSVGFVELVVSRVVFFIKNCGKYDFVFRTWRLSLSVLCYGTSSRETWHLVSWHLRLVGRSQPHLPQRLVQCIIGEVSSLILIVNTWSVRQGPLVHSGILIRFHQNRSSACERS